MQKDVEQILAKLKMKSVNCNDSCSSFASDTVQETESLDKDTKKSADPVNKDEENSINIGIE